MCVLVSLKSHHVELTCSPPIVVQSLSDSSRKSWAPRFTAVCVTSNCSGDVECSGRSWGVWNSGNLFVKERSGVLRRTHSSPSPNHCAGFALTGRYERRPALWPQCRGSQAGAKKDDRGGVECVGGEETSKPEVMELVAR